MNRYLIMTIIFSIIIIGLTIFIIIDQTSESRLNRQIQNLQQEKLNLNIELNELKKLRDRVTNLESENVTLKNEKAQLEREFEPLRQIKNTNFEDKSYRDFINKHLTIEMEENDWELKEVIYDDGTIDKVNANYIKNITANDITNITGPVIPSINDYYYAVGEEFRYSKVSISNVTGRVTQVVGRVETIRGYIEQGLDTNTNNKIVIYRPGEVETLVGTIRNIFGYVTGQVSNKWDSDDEDYLKEYEGKFGEIKDWFGTITDTAVNRVIGSVKTLEGKNDIQQKYSVGTLKGNIFSMEGDIINTLKGNIFSMEGDIIKMEGDIIKMEGNIINKI